MQLAADRRCAAALAAGSSVTAHGAATDDAARCSASHDATARLSTATNVPPVIDDAGLPSVADGIPSTAYVPLATDAARLSAAAYSASLSKLTFTIGSRRCCTVRTLWTRPSGCSDLGWHWVTSLF